MPSPLLIILGISSTLLGLYITIVSVINPQTRVDYHIGTYLSIDTSRSHSMDLRSRLQRVKMRDEHNRKLDRLIKTSQIVDNDIHTKSLSLAYNINTYIQQLVTTNNYQQSNMQFFTQLSKSRQQYSQCVQQLSHTINIDENKQLWYNYKQCFIKYQKQKSIIDQYFIKRRKLLQQIDDLMVYDPNSNKQFDLDQQLKKIKQRYDRQNAINDKNKQDLIIQLKKLQQKNQLKSTQLDQNQRQHNRTKLQYQICMKNLKQFRKCQDIAKALRQYGYVQTVQSLQQRIKSKREILVKLRQHVLQNRQAGGDNKVITEMYIKRQKQLIQTIKLRLDMGYDEMKQCGCKQNQRKKLQKQYQQSKIKLSINKKQVNQLLYQIFSYQKKIKQTDKKRQQLINQFRQDTQRLKNRQTTNILSLQQKLAVMKQNLKQINQQLSRYSPKMNSIQFQCNQYKDRLRMKLKDGQKVSDCMAKKIFYDGLRDKAAMIVKQEGNGLRQGKQKIKLLLQSIFYPQKLAISQFKLTEQQTNINNSIKSQPAQQTIISITGQQQITISHPKNNQIIIEQQKLIEVQIQPIVGNEQQHIIGRQQL